MYKISVPFFLNILKYVMFVPVTFTSVNDMQLCACIKSLFFAILATEAMD